jgi:hypothetical protein
MHHAAVSDWSKHERKREVKAENARPQIDLSDSDSLPRPKDHVVEYTAVLAKRDLPFCRAVEVIEDRLRQSPAGKPSKVFDVDDARVCDGT